MKLSAARGSRLHTGVAMSVLSASLVVAAVQADGYHATDVRLNDASVWTYNSERGFVSKINTQTVEAETGVDSPNTNEILQDEAVVYSLAGGQLYTWTAASGASTASEQWQADVSMAVSAGTSAMLDRASGNAWVAPASAMSGWKDDWTPTLTVAPGSALTVTRDGAALVVDPVADTVTRVTLDSKGIAVVGTTTSLKVDVPEPLDAQTSVSAVGDRVVVLTADGLVLSNGTLVPTTELGAEPSIQTPSMGGDSVYVASSTGLLKVGFDGSVAEVVALDGGKPARPVVVDGCVDAAWSLPVGQFAQACNGREPTIQPINEFTEGSRLLFHVNRSGVVLAGTGDEQWVVRDGQLVRITNWDQADPSLQPDPEEPKPLDETDDQTERECKDAEAAPTPRGVTPTFGAKPNGTITIDVVGLFDDVNCDPLAVLNVSSSADTEGSGPRAVAVNFGQSIQFRAPAETGSVTIEFTVSDGTPEHDVEGNVTVEVQDDSSSLPRLRNSQKQPTTAVQVNRTTTYNVLADWTDDDGDLLTLVNVSPPPGGGRVVYGADGMLTYTAETTTGEKILTVQVQDEAGNESEGSLKVVVQPAGTPIPPIARDDYATAKVGEEAVLYPLLNDTDANGDLATANVPRDVLAVRPELTIAGPDANQALVLSASAPGTYIIPYFAVDAQGKDARAAIRFDVVAPETGNRPPVAVSDAVVIREQRTANIDVVANDFDPDGDVLAVTEASLTDPALSGSIRVVVLDRRYVRVEVNGRPANPTFSVQYTISDGSSQPAVGELKVTVPTGQANQAPITQPDSAVVRAGQVVSVNVLANDRDPDGDQLFINPNSVKLAVEDAPGIVWLDGTTVRYRAGAEAPSAPVIVQYSVEDDPDLRGLLPVSGTVSIRVIPTTGPGSENDKPEPQPAELRVFTGSTATLRVPLTGIDPDGDRVILDGVETLPALGRVEIVGDTMVYHAGDAAGADSFQYRVRDTGLGSEDGLPLTGIATVRVVVVEGLPHSPVPLNDRLVTRPGRLVSVNVLANDTDADGDEIQLVGASSEEIDAVSFQGDRVDVQVPQTAGTYIVRYEIKDARSTSEQTGIITIVADPAAPLLSPVTRDDPDATRSPIGAITEYDDGSGGSLKAVEVRVVGNDDDPDGSPSALTAALVAGQGNDGAPLAPLATDTVRVILADDVQWLVYQATDPDGNVGTAVVEVPGLRNRQPVCRTDAVGEVSIPDGEPLTVKVADFVRDPDSADTVELVGQKPTIAVGSQGGVVGVTDNDFSQFTFAADNLETGQQVVLAVRVEDRKGQPDSQQVTCSVIINIARTNEPPTVVNGSFDVENATTGTVELGNLRDLKIVSDADEADTLTFEQVGENNQFGVSLTIAANGDVSYTAANATVGQVPQFRFTVTDGRPTTPGPVEGVISARIVTTTQPLPVIQNLTREDVKQGEPIDVDLSEGSFNPFPDKPLIFEVDKQPSQGAGAIAFNAGSSSLTFTPGADFFGVAIVGYSVTDKADRTVSATVTFTVIGRPGQPGQPEVTDVASHRAVVTWAPSDPKGTPITNYKVTWPGGEADAGTATTITLDSLTNGVPVQFTVVATNKVGDSDPSAQSGAVLPDQIPNPPDKPVISDFGDGTLTITWTEPVVDGTPIARYELYSSAGGDPKTIAPTERSVVWSDLSNGTPYTFSIVAVNGAGPSERSPSSDPLSPAREPDAPTAPTAADAGDGVIQQITVTWARPADNGRPITGYKIYVTPSGCCNLSYVIDKSSDPATTQTIPVGDAAYTFKVVAVNVVGDSQESGPSATVKSIKAPAAPQLSAASSDEDGLTTLSIFDVAYPTSGAGNGGCAAVIEYSINGGGWNGLAQNRQITGLQNGSLYSVKLRARNCIYPSPDSATRSFTPSGPPIQAGISISGSANGTTITWNWNATAAKNGAASYTFTFEGGSVGQSGSTPINYGDYATQHTVTVRVTDSLGRFAERSATVSTGPPPVGNVSIAQGGGASGSTCYYGDGASGDNQGCYYIGISLSGWTGTHTVRCYTRWNSTSAWVEFASFTAGNGYHDRCSYSSAGRVVVVTVDSGVGGNAWVSEAYLTSGSGALSNVYGPWPTN